MKTCKLCRRERAQGSQLCRYHLAAKRNLDAAYKAWSHAYGGMGWDAYLKAVMESPETGQWAKEVAGLLAKDAGGAD
ncbi:MAG: hypothetical protein JRM86_04700 [Nitrososphaerota archaeon]|nr:hypothetical protein [Nitrososphaerota archaeon]